jgi:hypothetical protein
MSRTGDEN